MPSIDLFEPRSEDAIRQALLDAKKQARVDMREMYEMAVDYLEGRQRDDVERELNARYERTQTGDRGGQIAAQVLPLTERYVAEAASAYNRPVKRKLVREDGTTDDERTRQLNKMLADSRYDEHMHRLDQYTVLLKSCGLWYQARAGQLRPALVMPHDMWPIMPDDDWTNPADQADYAGYVAELFNAEDETRADARRFVWSSPSQAAFYSGSDPFSLMAQPTVYENTFHWPQVIDADGLRGEVRTLPLQMMTVWNHRLPVGELIIDSDPAVALSNRELNLQLSILLDTIAHQGWATLLLNVLNPDSPPTQFSAGPRSGLALGADESATMLTGAVPYEGLVSVLQQWVRLIAIAQRQSPNDFSTEAVAATSGFAKQVDSLPKLEAREERTKRLAATERAVAWPRLGAIGSELGLISGTVEDLSRLTMVTEFSPVEFTESVPERVQREQHELATGQTTPAKILAKRRGITIEEATAEVAENTGADVDDVDDAGKGLEPGTTDENVQQTALNGAQVSALVGIIEAVAEGRLPRQSGVETVAVAFQLSMETADRLIGEAGRGFVSSAAPKPEPPAPPPPPPAPEPKDPRATGLLGTLIGGRGRR